MRTRRGPSEWLGDGVPFGACVPTVVKVFTVILFPLALLNFFFNFNFICLAAPSPSCRHAGSFSCDLGDLVP